MRLPASKKIISDQLYKKSLNITNIYHIYCGFVDKLERNEDVDTSWRSLRLFWS